MKKILTILLILLLSLNSVYANLYSPNRALYTIETEYFTIIFPKESENAALYLTSFADNAYTEICSLLNTKIKTHISVVLTPDSEELNGYYSSYPYVRIVLYQAPTEINSNLGSFEDDLYKLFYHELTHAVSLSIRSEFEDVITNIFGSSNSINQYLTPKSFVEGVTLSFESRNGHGRTEDPLPGAYLRQDILEDKWKSFSEASGAYNEYPWGNLFYMYGGYFSTYIQNTYGMEKYSQMWRWFSLESIYSPGCEELFGKSFDQLWNDFYQYMAIKEAVFMAPKTYLDNKYISALTVSDKNVIYADYYMGKICSFEDGKEKVLVNANPMITRLDCSNSNDKILISTTKTVDDFPRLQLKEYSFDGKIRDLEYTKIREAAYLGDNGITGIKIDSYTTDLVAIIGKTTSTLISGNEKLNLSWPVVSKKDKSILYVLAREDGKTGILRVHLEYNADNSVIVKQIEKLICPSDITWIRYCSIDNDDVLRFAWDNASLYKLAQLKDDILSYQTIPISGGVHSAVSVNGNIWYSGHFSSGHKLCSFPEDTSALGFKEVQIKWEEWNKAKTTSVYDNDNFTKQNEKAKINNYSVIPYLLPKLWLPNVSIDNTGINKAGISFVIQDPIERINSQTDLFWNISTNTFDFNTQTQFTHLGLPIIVNLSDNFYKQETKIARSSEIGLSANDTYSFFSGPSLSWAFGTMLDAFVLSEATYSTWDNINIAAEAQLSLADKRHTLYNTDAILGYATKFFARTDIGNPFLSAENNQNSNITSPIFSFEAMLEGCIPFLSSRLAAFGGLCANTSTESTASYSPKGRIYSNGDIKTGIIPVWKEFEDCQSGGYLVSGEFSSDLLQININSGNYLYLNKLFIKIGARAVLIGKEDYSKISDFAYSAFARIMLRWTPAIGAASTIHPTSYVECWLRPDKIDDNGNVNMGFSFMLFSL